MVPGSGLRGIGRRLVSEKLCTRIQAVRQESTDDRLYGAGREMVPRPRRQRTAIFNRPSVTGRPTSDTSCAPHNDEVQDPAYPRPPARDRRPSRRGNGEDASAARPGDRGRRVRLCLC